MVSDYEKLPLEARRRLWIITVAHVQGWLKLHEKELQDIYGRWVANGDLTESEWDILERLAHEAMVPAGQSD